MKQTVKVRIVLLTLVLCAASLLIYQKLTKQELNVPQNLNRVEDYKQNEYLGKIDGNDYKEKVSTTYLYVLKPKEKYVAIYYANSNLLFDQTSIILSELPDNLQTEICLGKPIYSKKELYDFLENFSS